MELRGSGIGLVPQGHTALRALTVLDNVLLPSVLYSKNEAPADRARELLVAVGLGDLTDAAPTELSGGELRRMAIARALLMDPAIVLADEPTAGLDHANATAVLTLLRDAADRGAAVLVVSHEAEARSFADRCYTMEDGHLSEN